MPDVLTKNQRSYNRPQILSGKNFPMDHNRPKVLDLFAGAGGLSEGFIRAGCEIIGHIEMDQNACNTLITRMVYHALLQKGKMDEYKNYVLGKITRESLIEKYQFIKNIPLGGFTFDLKPNEIYKMEYEWFEIKNCH